MNNTIPTRPRRSVLHTPEGRSTSCPTGFWMRWRSAGLSRCRWSARASARLFRRHTNGTSWSPVSSCTSRSRWKSLRFLLMLSTG